MSGSATSCTQRGTWIRMVPRWVMRAMVPTASDGLRLVLYAAADMPSSRPRPNGRRRIEPRQRIERRQARSARRARRFALLVLLAAVFVGALVLVAFGGQSNRTVPLASSPLTLLQSRPSPEIVAHRGPVNLQLPIAQARVTAIGYSAASDALPLSPGGHQANEGLVSRVIHGIFGSGAGNPRWFQLGGGGTNALDVGAVSGTDAYAPVDGIVAAIRPFVLMGRQYGSEIDIQPQSSPSLIVAVTQVATNPALTVGSAVVSGTTKLGTVVDLARVEQQALAQYTNDGGNHVTIEVRAAPVVTTG
jgi:hypothetical protein